MYKFETFFFFFIFSFSSILLVIALVQSKSLNQLPLQEKEGFQKSEIHPWQLGEFLRDTRGKPASEDTKSAQAKQHIAMCGVVCSFCRKKMSLRISSLCFIDCAEEGEAFVACAVAFWNTHDRMLA